MGKIELKGVEKAFGTVKVIQGVDLTVDDGSFVVFVGPSGCGKSTLLRLIAGLEDATDGAILIDGVDVIDQPPAKRGLSMVFQSYALYPHMTVRNNIGFGLRMAGISKEERDKKVDAAAALLNLTPYLERRPSALSGGQRQRVAMGRAIVRDPAVFLFDEPLSNLDAKLRVQMRTEIKALHQRLRTTSVYVTHDQVEAMTMADRIVVLNDGRVEQVGEPLAIYDRPDNLFVAAFIGSPAMNFITGRLRRDGGARAWVEAADGTALPLQAPAPERADGAVVFGVRPEHLELADGEGGIACKVSVVEPTGADTLVFARMAGIDICAVFDERHQFKPGQVIHLSPRAGTVHLFDAATGGHL